MDFSFSEEERLIGDSLQSFFADTYDAEARRKAIVSDTGWRPAVWHSLASDLGVLGAALPEDAGGLGLGAGATFVVMREIGKALVVEPFLETAVMAAGLLARAGDSERARTALQAIVAGELVVAVAWGEPSGRDDPNDVATTAKADGDGWRLDGAKGVVLGTPWASQLLVTARTGGGRRDADGISLFLVDKNAAGVTTRDYATVDGRRAAEVTFEDVALPADALIGPEGAAGPIVEAVMDEARAALCAEACGVLEEMVRQTIDYARQRRQFEAPIASFQVIQHRLVDMFIAQEQALSMALMATVKLDRPADERAAAVSAAKTFVGRACTRVAQEAMQIHGGIGLTDELPFSHYFKRATTIEQALGSSDFHLRRFERLRAGQRIADPVG